MINHYPLDDNQLSKEFAETLDDSAVLKRLSDQNNFLAVKLKSGSENYTFFAQICILFSLLVRLDIQLLQCP